MLNPKIKICCISSVEEAKIAISYGATAIGLVGNMPSGPGVIDDGQIRLIARTVPPEIDTFLLTSETRTAKIIQHHKRTQTTTIQIVDKPEEGSYAEIRKEIPSIKLVQVIHVIGENSIEEAIQASVYVDEILLDSGNPNLSIKELGGTGRVHDWKLSRKICENIKVPLYLAGGLNSENITEAIEEVRPYGIDICSGVRTSGKLDEKKLSKFVQNIFA